MPSPLTTTEPSADMTFFLTFQRGNELVFAREVRAPNFFAALHRARQAMVRMGVATQADFASGRVRPTNVGELPAEVATTTFTRRSAG